GAPNQIQALAPPSNLKINEWMASPESGDDWFELYNPADRPLALSGLHLTDDLADPTNNQLVDLSFIGPHEFTRFIADGSIDKGAEHVGFKLSGGGEVIAVFDSNGSTPIDSITFGPQITGVSQGRLPDGAATLVSFPTTASPGDPNHLPLSSVVIS